MQPGDVLIATQSAQHDYGDLTETGMKHEGIRNPATGKRAPLFLPADARLLKLAEETAAQIKLQPIELVQGERTPKIVKGIVVTGDVFVATSQKKAELRKNLQADAVEMEGAAVAQVCHQQEVPCLVIRSLSDLADANAPKDAQKFGRAAAENGKKDPWVIVKRPPISLCVHGINDKYCKTCLEKKAAKSAKSAKSAKKATAKATRDE
jgi:adenosylhomocysteine nucleosidase